MGIDLRDYSRTGAQRGWGAGWPSCGGAKAAGTAVVTADRSGTRFSVHKRIARLVDLISDECERRGYLFKPGQTGGYNCFAGETLVMTPDGDVPIADLAGTTAKVLTQGRPGDSAGPGRWVDAEVRSFGVQSLRRVVLTRRGVLREVYATPGHRWFLDEPDRTDQERTTDGLRPGQRLAAVHPQSVATRVGLSSVGAAHGIVFGDGTVSRHDARVMLCGSKNALLLRFFPEPHVLPYDVGLLVCRLPKSWKRLPSLDEGPSYLYGFLAGYFAADGDVSKRGQPRISCASRETLTSIRVVCTRLGIATTGIAETKRAGITGEVSSLYSITMSARNLTDAFFLIDSHRERFLAAPKRYAPARWRVVSVGEANREEQVFCAVVPGTESFALADNLLTGNCRAIGGTSSPSNHSWGLAIDVNWRDNPMRRPLTTDIPDWMVDLWNRYGFAWGGHYSSTPDSMHFEFMGTPAQADEMTALALRELVDGDTTPAAGPVMLRRGDTGPAVADLQRALGITADGDFGPVTEAAVRAFQTDRGLDVDGIAGPATLAALTPATPAPVPEDDMNDDDRRLLREIHQKLHGRHPTRVDYRTIGERPPAIAYADDIGGYAINADARAYEARQLVQQVRAAVAELAARPGGGPGGPVTVTDADVARIAAAVVDQLARRIGA